jgi:pyrroloquinoline quinone (PQQ) biosynthesis protein C
MSSSRVETLTIRLNENRLRRQFANHQFFRHVKDAPLDMKSVAVFLGQWWHPLHYFPTFLARCVSALPDIESKSAISRILNQETGAGDPKRAHEVIYADTMERAGFARPQIMSAAPFEETTALVAGYERASSSRFRALGVLFATEVTDLMMVSGLGTAVERVTGVTDLEWVKIHVEQEPDHVEEAGHVVLGDFNETQESLVMNSAEEMWLLWTAFFDRLEMESVTD